MYIVLVGPSGKCRKGTAMTPGMKMLREMGIRVAAESITREALIRELKSCNDSQVDVTCGSMHIHASLTIYSQELTVFLGYNNQALMADLTDWFDCRDSWTYRTKNQGTDEIIGVWVNLFGATTPELLQTTLPQDAIGGGLTSRMIFVYESNKAKVVPVPILSREEREIQDKLINDLNRICMMTGDFTVTDAFIERYTEWYMNYSSNKPPFDDYRFAGYLERRPTHLLKLCMIVSASHSDAMVIDKVDFDRALGILELTEKKMPYTFSGVGKANTAEVMQRVMATIRMTKSITLGELLSRFYQDIDKMTLEKMIESLRVMGFADTVREGDKWVIKYIDKQKLM
jgi:hypothetical protein